MPLTSSMEDYLEAVLVLQQQKGYVRCVDVAELLDVKKPSVSRAVKELEKMGLSAPKMTYLMHSLAEKGYDLSTDILTVSDAAGEILNLWRKTRMEDGEK